MLAFSSSEPTDGTLFVFLERPGASDPVLAPRQSLRTRIWRGPPSLKAM